MMGVGSGGVGWGRGLGGVEWGLGWGEVGWGDNGQWTLSVTVFER